MEDARDSDFINDDVEDKQPPKSKRKRNTPKRKKHEKEAEHPEDDGGQEVDGVDNESQIGTQNTFIELSVSNKLKYSRFDY